MTLFKINVMGTPISKQIIEDFEIAINSRLPKDYKKHMLNYNGGRKIKSENLYYTKYKSEEGELILNSLFNLSGGGDSVESASKFYDYLPKAIVIGDFHGGIIVLSLSDNDYGSIYMQFSYTEPEKIATSFTEFLNGLEYDE